MPSAMSEGRSVQDKEHTPVSSGLPAPTKRNRARSPGSEAAATAGSSRSTPAKRARKAINCEPCRTSKVKCDRNRPCSSCVLRGTTALCYQSHGNNTPSHVEEERQSEVDPALELSRIRHSLALLESAIAQQTNSSPAAAHPGIASTSATSPESSGSEKLSSHPTPTEQSLAVGSNAESATLSRTPGILGHKGPSGLYSGPTSLAAQFIYDRDESEYSDDSLSQSDAGLPDHHRAVVNSVYFTSNGVPHQFDLDLLQMLPPSPIIDGMIKYYFDNCNWTSNLIDEVSFMASWARFKSGQSGDRITLCTATMIMGLALRYMPEDHELRATQKGTTAELCERYFVLVQTALRRHRDNRDKLASLYTVEMVQLLLINLHYLGFARDDPEEAWALRGMLMTIATAMGMHRDPGMSRSSRHMIGRRRFLWWRIHLVDTWLAFLYGRPLSIHPHHFNTLLPTPNEPPFEGTGTLLEATVELFRLGSILQAIMEDAVSFRPVEYSSVQDKDKHLTDWRSSLSAELSADDATLWRNLSNPNKAVHRLAVKAISLRCAFYHVRFSLHRPYTSIAASRDIAVESASQLIGLIRQTRPDIAGPTAVGIPLFMNWGPFHIFAGAMFFVFELAKQPDHPDAGLYRENIRKALASMEWSRGMSVADKGLMILETLAPLYTDELMNESPEERQRKKAQVISRVKTLAFPYLYQPPKADSPARRPPQFGHAASVARDQLSTQTPVSSMRWMSPDSAQSTDGPYASQLADGGQQQRPPQPSLSHLPQHHQPHDMSTIIPSEFAMPSMYVSNQDGIMLPSISHQTRSLGDMRYADDVSGWGFTSGVNLGAAEWSQLLDFMDPSVQQSQPRGVYGMQQ